MAEFKNLPRFDSRHVDYADQFNATSEAVMQLQKMVHDLQSEVTELKEAKPTRAASAKTAAK